MQSHRIIEDNILAREIWTGDYTRNLNTLLILHKLWDLKVWEISLIAIITSRCRLGHLVKLFVSDKYHIKSEIYWQLFSWGSCERSFKTNFLSLIISEILMSWKSVCKNQGWALTGDDVSPDNMKSISSNCKTFWGAETHKHITMRPYGHWISGECFTEGSELEIFIRSYFTRPQHQSQAFFIVSNYSYKHVIISLRTFYAIFSAKKLFIFCNSML